MSNVTWSKVLRDGLTNHNASGKFEEGAKEVAPGFKIVGVRPRSVSTLDSYGIKWSLVT